MALKAHTIRRTEVMEMASEYILGHYSIRKAFQTRGTFQYNVYRPPKMGCSSVNQTL